jgi:hypothetical protein
MFVVAAESMDELAQNFVHHMATGLQNFPTNFPISWRRNLGSA